MLSTLKKSFAAPAAALGLASATLLIGVPAHAQDNARLASTSTSSNTWETSPDSERAIDRVKLAGGDIRGKGIAYGEGMAIKASAKFAVLKIHTDDPAVIQNMETELKTLVMLGYERLALIVADGPTGADNSAELYVVSSDGLPQGKMSGIDAYNAEAVLREVVRENYPRVWIKEQASVHGPTGRAPS